jgi:hypothetical protein
LIAAILYQNQIAQIKLVVPFIVIATLYEYTNYPPWFPSSASTLPAEQSTMVKEHQLSKTPE